MENNVIEYFNLLKDGDSAIVRLLHTKVETIEKANLHYVEVDGKKKAIKCCGDNCPCCEHRPQHEQLGGNPRIFIHLYDYIDGKEKVWNRTDKIISQLQSIENDWGDLSDCVLRITRSGDQFPKYSISILNAKQYEEVDKSLVDKKIAYRFYLTRSIDELNEFYKTGVMPKHNSTFMSKEDYKKLNANDNQNVINNNISISEAVKSELPSTPIIDDDDYDPFVDAVFNKVRKV